MQRSLTYLKVFSLALLLSLLYACGGGGGGTADSSPITPPPPNAGSAILSWDAVTTNIDGSPYTDPGGYRIYYSETSPVTRSNSTILTVGANITTIEIGGLVTGHTYYFRVGSFDMAGNETLSEEEVNKSIM